MMVKAAIAETNRSLTREKLKVAWLLQDAGAYWQPIMSEFQRLFPQAHVFTATWNGFLPGFDNSFNVTQVGAIKVLKLPGNFKGYAPCITYLSPSIATHIARYRPDVVFSTGFSIWTMLVCILKLWYRWQVVIVYDGSSPGVNQSGLGVRAWQRRLLIKMADAAITNNKAGKLYLIDTLGANKSSVFARPYLMPHPDVYAQHLDTVNSDISKLQKPIFIFAGHLIPRKGLRELLKACLLLKKRGHKDYTLLILGDGPERQYLETFVHSHDLKTQVEWVGEVKYEYVGAYFKHSDIFVFPTREDVWGMVLVEAMMFGLPILGSKWGGAVEMVQNDENGYIFDPHDPETLADAMERFIQNPELIQTMGAKSRQIMSEYTPDSVAESLEAVVQTIMA